MMKKILIVNPFGIGDVIFSTPLIEVLKKNFPDSYIGYLCNKRASELIATNPYLNRIFIYEKDEYREVWERSKAECVKKLWRLLMSIRRERFGISIDLSLGYQYSMLLKFIGVKKRLGFNYRDRGRFLTDKVDINGFNDKHVIDYYLDVLNCLKVDIKKNEVYPKVFAPDESLKWADTMLKDAGITNHDLLIGVIPGCGASWGQDAKYRRWGKDSFALLADRLIAKYNAKIILLGDAKEAEICDDVQRLMKNKVLNCCGKTSIGEFLGILARCKAIVTNDGGPLHMAVGLGKKTISIFGPVDEVVYGPYPPQDHIVISKKDLPCRPCYKKFKYTKCEKQLCLSSITVDEILKASEGILSR